MAIQPESNAYLNGGSPIIAYTRKSGSNTLIIWYETKLKGSVNLA